jgi:hypothetical protein
VHKASSGVLIKKVSFLRPGRAMFVWSDANGDVTECTDAVAPKTQSDVEDLFFDAAVRCKNLHAILMLPQDFNVYNDGCVAKETVKI